MCREGMYESEAWGRPRDASRFPPPRGNGFYSQDVYYRVLDAGLRVPPSAGSASGVLPNPLGYDRVYVRIDGPLRWDAWWAGLSAGRCFVTNGPLLLASANGHPPGAVLAGSGEVRVDLDLKVMGNDPIEALEAVRDGGEVVSLVPGASADEDLRGARRPAPMVFRRSGWLLVRAIARVPSTFRFASTAPWYVEVDGRPRTVHREAVEGFLRWIDERIAALERSPDLADPAEREEALRPQREARRFFEGLLEEARRG